MSRSSVVLEEYDPSWPEKFKSEKARLLDVAGQWSYGSVEHVGSTSIEGMIAKPVIDIMFGVKTLEDSKLAIDALVKAGYNYWPYKPDLMHWFCKPSDAFRTHHLHLIPFESDLWKERIKFREILRANNKLANDYANLKRELASQYRENREAYTQEKWPFIKRILQHS